MAAVTALVVVTGAKAEDTVKIGLGF